MCWVRGPSSSTGRILVRESMANHRKTHLLRAAQPGTQFVQLHMREPESAERALMEELSVLACPSEPPRDGLLTIAEDAFSRRRIQPFGQRGEHHADLLRGRFQVIQGVSRRALKVARQA
jgi:hypothetical protein